MSPRRRDTQLPNWLWFFLVLPGALIVALLWKRRSQRVFRFRFGEEAEPERYIEPDSIPLEIHAPEVALEAALEESAEAGPITLEEPPAPLQPAERTISAIPTQPAQPDDLKIIEGIGPAISGILHDSGITTFRALAGAPLEQLDAILVQAKLRRLADPETWPEQAGLAADGKWEELETLQRSLKAGRRRKDL
jgi:predicted flap endonuclease-1-like 5' DNA nuclease